jgi:hypothetical protein
MYWQATIEVSRVNDRKADKINLDRRGPGYLETKFRIGKMKLDRGGGS